MKIAFVYDRFSLNKKKFHLDQLFDHPSGLTGSESSCFFYAIEMAKLGHQVSFYSIFDKNYEIWNEIKTYHIDKIRENHQNYDVIYSWNEPNLFQTFDAKCLRIVNQQLNDFNYCWQDYDKYVDWYTSPSHTHAWMLSQTCNLNFNKFIIIPNGVNLDRFKNTNKINGRIIYNSSPDRGLHWILSIWEKIKKYAPHANLRIYYELNNWYRNMENWSYHMINKNNIINIELLHRANYIKYALEKLKHLDVKHEGSNSYNKISENLNLAEIFLYPCDPVIWTEGFSVSTLEACAAGTCPIISDINSLGEIYKNGAWILPSPIKDYLNNYIDITIDALTNKTLREEKAHTAQEFAKKYDYKILASKLSDILTEKLQNQGKI